jgi:hypothetical protein
MRNGNCTSCGAKNWDGKNWNGKAWDMSNYGKQWSMGFGSPNGAQGQMNDYYGDSGRGQRGYQTFQYSNNGRPQSPRSIAAQNRPRDANGRFVSTTGGKQRQNSPKSKSKSKANGAMGNMDNGNNNNNMSMRHWDTGYNNDNGYAQNWMMPQYADQFDDGSDYNMMNGVQDMANQAMGNQAMMYNDYAGGRRYNSAGNAQYNKRKVSAQKKNTNNNY